MEELRTLVERAEKEPENRDRWSDIIAFAEKQYDRLMSVELKELIVHYFEEKKKELPNEVHIKMDKEWESDGDYYEYLSSVTVFYKDEREKNECDDDDLKDFLNGYCDLSTLSKNPVVYLQ